MKLTEREAFESHELIEPLWPVWRLACAWQRSVGAQSDHSGDGGEKTARSGLLALMLDAEEGRASDRHLGAMFRVLVDDDSDGLRRIAAQAAAVPQDGGDEREAAKRLIQRHANAARALEHMYTEKNVARLKLIGEELEAALAQKAVPMSAPAESSVPVNFLGIDPLEISRGAHLPMIPESWRYGFRKTANGYDFSFQDDGPLVAWDAVKDIVAQKAVPVVVAQPSKTFWQEIDRIAGDYSPSKADEAVIALGEMREALHTALSNHAPAPIASAEEAVPVLDKPAKVGGTRFGKGVKWSTVIGAAQRLYEFDVTPEKEAERIERARATVEAIQRGDYATHPAAAQPSRAEVLEHAAMVCDDIADDKSDSGYVLVAQDCAAQIRALKDQK